MVQDGSAWWKIVESMLTFSRINLVCWALIVFLI